MDDNPNIGNISEHSTEENVDILYRIIKSRRVELRSANDIVAKKAKSRNIFASIVKASVIFLGAFVAVKEVANQIIGTSNIINIIMFTLAGSLIAILTGLEAAFKWENTSAQLKSLAATSRAASRKVSSDLARVYATKNSEEKVKELENILSNLDDIIADTQKKADKLGLDTTLYGYYEAPLDLDTE